MKVVYSLIIFFIASSATAQSLYFNDSLNNKRIVVLKQFTKINEKSVLSGKLDSINFIVNGIMPNESLRINIKDYNSGTAKRDTDYKYKDTTYKNKTITVKNTSGKAISKTFAIKIQKVTPKKTYAIIYIELQNDENLTKTYMVELDFNNTTDEVTTRNKIMPDTSKWSLDIVTGGNFDFFNGPTIKNFAGEINLFVPNIYKKFGVQFGLFNFQYSQADSSGSFTNHDYYYLNPQDNYRSYDSTKIVKREFSVKRSINYNIWGAYLDPMYQVFSNDFAQLYLSLHLEALITTQTYTPNLTYLFKDTLNYVANTSIDRTILAHPAIYPPYSKSTYYDFYYGVGLH